MVILEAPRIIIKRVFANMIIPFVMLESTLIAFIVLATLGSFQAASTLLSFWCKWGFGMMIGSDCVYKEHVRGITV